MNLPISNLLGNPQACACPICRSRLNPTEQVYHCSNCETVFPVIDGIPILINESNSIFTIEDFIQNRRTTFNLQPTGFGKARRILQKLLPDINRNTKSPVNYRKFAECLTEKPSSTVLVLGGSVLGQGMEALSENDAITLVETDVCFGDRTQVICDAHDLPFADASFDGVIIQAVLEHVVDPYRCVAEIHRVLKSDGLVYAETPFVQQVHMGQHDFTRFTHLGHRRLFRAFDEIESGAVCGPGVALAWSYQYFLMSFARSRVSRGLLIVFSNLTAFFLKYFDDFLLSKPGALDAASSLYFMGRKSETMLDDKDLVQQYRGWV
jgi:SAM-dependent methyltransferase